MYISIANFSILVVFNFQTTQHNKVEGQNQSNKQYDCLPAFM